MNTLTDLSFLLFLIVLNGLFAMSEIAIVSSKRVRLLQMAEGGQTGARQALALASEPTRFLSSVQVGITCIGIMSGAIGEGAIADRLRPLFERFPVAAPHAEMLSLGTMVVLLTYVSLILGELVPKRLALTHPETIASLVARPMTLLARIGRPIVQLLTISTDTFLRLAGVRPVKQPVVTMEEIRVLLEQGAEEGVFEPTEHEMVSNVLNLDERRVGAVMTPRTDLVFIDLREPIGVTRDKMRHDSHAVLPLCDGGLDNVVGFVRSTKVLDQLLDEQTCDLGQLAEVALFVPETMTLMKLLEQFKRTHLPIALVVNEFGGVEGLVSLTDVISSIVGDLPAEPGEEPSIVTREDGSWLVDGGIDLDTLLQTLDADALIGDDDRQHYHTLGGFAMSELGRIPRTGDAFRKGAYRFEIVDMDGNRVDRVWISRAADKKGPRDPN